MTSKSLSSENKKHTGISMGALIRQGLRGHMALLLLGLVVMLFNYPVNLAMRLTETSRNFTGLEVVHEAASAAAVEQEALSTIGGADGPTSIFVAEKQVETLAGRLTEEANQVLLGNATLIPLIVGVAALLCAFSMFRWTYSRRQTDFYQALPVSRGKRFLASYLGGFLIMLICYAAGLLGALLTAAVFQVQDLMLVQAVLVNAGYLLQFLLIYTVTIIAILLCGNLAVGVMSAAWILGVGPVLYGLIYALKTASFDTLYDPAGKEDLLQYLSPVKYLVEYTYYPNMLGRQSDLSPGAFARLYGETAPHTVNILLLSAALTVLTFGIAFWLFRKRASEGAGNALAFPKVAMPIRILTTVAAAVYLSLFGFSMESLPWIIFLALAGALIVHGLMEGIFHLDVKAVLAHKLELLICMLLSVGLACIFWFDLPGINSWLPKQQEVASVSIYAPGYTQDSTEAVSQAESYYGRYGTEDYDPEGVYEARYYQTNSLAPRMALTEPAAVEAALKLGEEGVRQNNQNSRGERLDYDSREYVRVIYRMKDGRVNDRDFYVSKDTLRELIPELFAMEEYKEAAYPILTVPEEAAGSFGFAPARNVEVEDLPGWEVQDDMYYIYYMGEERQAYGPAGDREEFSRKLLKALQEDIREMNYQELKEYFDEQQARDERTGEDIPAADRSCLVYVTKEELTSRSLIPEERYGYDYVDTYPILDSFDHVKEVLAEYGLSL